jgi:hypothetical protein
MTSSMLDVFISRWRELLARPEGFIDKLIGISVHLAGNPRKLPCLEELEGLLDLFVRTNQWTGRSACGAVLGA